MFILYKVKQLTWICLSDKFKRTNLQARCKFSNNIPCLVFSNLIATCAAGIEAITANELKHLGYDVQTENGRVRFSGTMKDVFETNLWLRTADRIKIVVAEFEARTFDELFEKTKALPWDEFLPLDAEFPVSGKSQKSKLHR